jgi:hypothetical protein
MVRIVTGDTSKDPSGGKDDTSPADKEGNTPESILVGFIFQNS